MRASSSGSLGHHVAHDGGDHERVANVGAGRHRQQDAETEDRVVPFGRLLLAIAEGTDAPEDFCGSGRKVLDRAGHQTALDVSVAGEPSKRVASASRTICAGLLPSRTAASRKAFEVPAGALT